MQLYKKKNNKNYKKQNRYKQKPKKEGIIFIEKEKPGEKTQSNRLKRNVQRETETKKKNKTSINQQTKHNKHTIHIHTYTYIIHKQTHTHKCTYFPIVHTNQEIV